MDILKNLNQSVAIQVILIILITWLCMIFSQRFLPWLADKFSGRHRWYILALVTVFNLLLILTGGAMIISRIVTPTFQNLVGLIGALGLAIAPRDQFRFITDLTVRGKAALKELDAEFAAMPVSVTH